MYMKNVYEKCKFKQILCCKYATNLKTTISQWSLSNLGLLLLLFEFNNFSFSIKIMDNILYTSVSCDQNSSNSREVYWSCDTDGDR